MIVNRAASPLRIAAVFSASAFLAAPAVADLTAKEAASRIQSWLAAQGGRFEADSVSEGPGGFKLKKVRIGSKEDRETVSLVLDWLNLAARDDGAVAIELPEKIVFVHGERIGSFGDRQIEIPGLGGAVAENGTGLSLTLSGPDFLAKAAGKNPLTDDAEQQQFSLRNWRVDAELEEGSGDAPLQLTFVAEEMKSVIAGDAVGSTAASAAEPRASFFGTTDQLFDGQYGQFGLSPTRYSLSFASANWVAEDTVGGGPGFGLSAGPADFGYSSDADEVEVDAAVDEIAVFLVLPGRVLQAVQLSEFKAEAAAFDRRENDRVAFSLRLAVPEVVVNRDLLAAVGADRALPPDATRLLTGKLVLDHTVEVPGEQGRQILDGQQMSFDAPGRASFWLHELWLEFFGIKLTGHGEINQLMGTSEPIGDHAFGELQLEFEGIGEKLDLAAENGFIPLDMQLFLKGLAAMGEAIDDDRLGYTFEFAGEDGIFLNGTRIR